MKGNSLSNNNLKHLVDQVRSKLLECKIPVLCEVYDGQWHKHIVESDTEGKHLTKLYGREIWNKYASYSKDKCLEELNTLSIVKKSTQMFISETGENTFTTPEIELTRGALNEMFVGTKKHLMQCIHSVPPVSHPDLFKKIEIDNEKRSV